MRLMVIGCGSIGTTLVKAVEEMPGVSTIYLLDKSRARVNELVSGLQKAVAISEEELSEGLGEVDLVIEAASQGAARHFVPIILEHGVDIMVMSVGAFADDDFREMAFAISRQKRARILIPSGAVCGTDGLHSASAGEIDEVRLITTKSPKSLMKIQYFKDKGIDIDSITEPTVVFEGTAREASTLFPRNMNVSATLSLLGVGFERTKVTIVCDPATERNSHRVVVKGPFGEMTSETHNVPSPMNPSTSYLAALSAIAAIKRIVDNNWIGI